MEKRTKIINLIVEYLCTTCSSGNMIRIDETFEHVCTNCNKKELLPKEYPRREEIREEPS